MNKMCFIIIVEFRVMPYFDLINALVYVNIAQGNHEVKMWHCSILQIFISNKWSFSKLWSKKTISKPEWSCFCFSSVPQIRWEWKRAFLRIWKLPTKIFHHIKKENPIHATLADAFLLQGRFLRKYIKRQIKWHSSQRKTFLWHFFDI